ncbi:hypothetical protein SLA2020_274150 [Shorea laevis]
MECKAKIQKLSILAIDGFHLFESLEELLDDADLELVSALARGIWLRRNSVIFGGHFLSPSQLHAQGLSSDGGFSFGPFRSNIQTGAASPPAAYVVEETNRRPDEGQLGCSHDLHSHRMGVGVILRDATGGVQAAWCCSVPFITHPSTAEALALWKAVVFCLDLGYQRLHLEGDALRDCQCCPNFRFQLELLWAANR